MARRNFQNYLFYANTSFDYVKQYDLLRRKNPDDIAIKEKLLFHLFCFPQIIYALRDMLVYHVSTDEERVKRKKREKEVGNPKAKRIFDFFSCNQKSVGKVISLANE